MKNVINVAVIYKKSYVFLTGKHFDKSLYYFFMEALKRNKKLDITYFPSETSFDVSEIKDRFDIILLPHNRTDGVPDELIGIAKLKIPVIARAGDPHEARKFDPKILHKKWKIDYYFNFMPKNYFYDFYPKDFRYKEILWGLEPRIYEKLKPFKDRIKDKILISGNVGKTSLKSRIANKIFNHKNSTYYFYKLRVKCRGLPYVHYSPMKNSKYENDDYPIYLSQYRASIAAATYYPVTKYFEIPASGCLTFMEVTKLNGCKYLGFKDGKTAIFINEKNYKEKFEEYINDVDNPKWEKIANAGREHVLKNLNSDIAVESLVELMNKVLEESTK
jgi:hypothetical protein